MDFLKEIDEKISNAIKWKDPLLKSYRNLKSDFKYLTSKYPDKTEIQILVQMRNERTENVEIYNIANRPELKEIECNEIKIINDYLPKEPSEEEVLVYLNTLSDIDKTPKNFRVFLNKCEERFGAPIPAKYISHFYRA